MLPADDDEFLNDRFPVHNVVAEAGMTCIVVPGLILPRGLSHDTSDLLLRLSPGYPDVPPDMWWFDPGLRRSDGRTIDRTESIETYLGRRWQRWSRHLPPGLWRSGSDRLRSYFTLIDRELRLASLPVAA